MAGIFKELEQKGHEILAHRTLIVNLQSTLANSMMRKVQLMEELSVIESKVQDYVDQLKQGMETEKTPSVVKTDTTAAAAETRPLTHKRPVDEAFGDTRETPYEENEEIRRILKQAEREGQRRAFVNEHGDAIIDILVKENKNLYDPPLLCGPIQPGVLAKIPHHMHQEYNIASGIHGTAPRYGKQNFKIKFGSTELTAKRLDTAAHLVSFEDPRNASNALKEIHRLYAKTVLSQYKPPVVAVEENAVQSSETQVSDV